MKLIKILNFCGGCLFASGFLLYLSSEMQINSAQIERGAYSVQSGLGSIEGSLANMEGGIYNVESFIFNQSPSNSGVTDKYNQLKNARQLKLEQKNKLINERGKLFDDAKKAAGDIIEREKGKQFFFLIQAVLGAGLACLRESKQ